MRQRYTDYPELTGKWSRQQCQYAKLDPHRLLVVGEDAGVGCLEGMANPYMPSDRKLVLRGYYPVVLHEIKGGKNQSAMRVEATVMCSRKEFDGLHTIFGSQLDSAPRTIHLADLSSDRVIASGQLQSWTGQFAPHVDLVFGYSLGTSNLHNIIDELVTEPRTIQVPQA